MNLMIQIYIIVCVVLLVFDIAFLMVKNVRNHRFYPKMTKFEEQVTEEIEKRKETGSFSDVFVNELKKKISKTKYMISLMSVLENYPEAKEWFKPFIFACIEDYKKKSDYEQAYYTYIISVLGYDEEKIPKEYAGEFMQFLDSKSLYTFINTMNAAYEFGETNLLLTAIDKVDERAGFYHKKLFVDGLLQAKGDRRELGKKLIEKFDRYTDFTKGCLLDYFRFANIEASELCMKLVKEDAKDEEIKYAAIRYFIKHPNVEAKEYFISVLKDNKEEWIEEMLAIQGLSRYEEDEIRELIKEKITSRDWYVRVNAADYMQRHGLTKEEVAEIIALKDRYANETLRYQYQKDEGMFEYITELIEKGDDQ